jgi:hypothetical protein
VLETARKYYGSSRRRQQEEHHMAIGKYVTNVGVITSVLGGVGVAKQTSQMPRDWRRFLVWGVWGASVALAIASVAKADEDNQFLEDSKEAKKDHKQAQKALKKAKKQAENPWG